MSAETDLSQYRACVGIMIINDDGMVWMGLRADAPQDAEGPGDWWQMPQGGIDEGEEPDAAALRELQEETGITSADILGRTAGWLLYDLPPQLQGKAWGGRHKGQKQVWYAVRLTGTDDEITLDPPDGLDHKKEFEAWQWTPIEDVVSRVVAFKREVYAEVVGELGVFAKPAST
jgi:putative (di)nucleoside polyphosphate hydrolase